MPELGNKNESNFLELEKTGSLCIEAPRLDLFNIPQSQEERLEWVRKSCERFFEKIREHDALFGLSELN